jgi:hypothetical protein
LLDTTAAIDFWNAAVKPAMVCSGSRPCENAKAINRDRTTYSFKIVFGAHIARAFNFEVERKNIILVTLRTFEFSHKLGHFRPSLRALTAI